MKKLIVPVLCVLVGSASGALMMTAATAQPSPSAAPRWQFECAVFNRNARGNLDMGELTRHLRQRATSGWDLATNLGDDVLCFKRPAP